MGLKDILESNNIPLPSDFDERLNVVQKGLRREPGFESELEKFKSGVDSGTSYTSIPITDMDDEDWLGPNIRSFLDAITSPAARGVLKSMFMVIFFMSYIEQIPVFGRILSASLDVMIASGKMITKTIQRNIPPLVGLIPLPYMSLIGMIMAGVLGAIVWPIIAMVSLSRQDFAAAIESFIRVIPPPFGDTIADMFLEGNRMIAKLSMKKQKLVEDITNAIQTISNVIKEAYDTASSSMDNVSALTTNELTNRMDKFSKQLQEVSSVTPVGARRHKRLSTRKNKKGKWTKTRRTRYVRR